MLLLLTGAGGSCACLWLLASLPTTNRCVGVWRVGVVDVREQILACRAARVYAPRHSQSTGHVLQACPSRRCDCQPQQSQRCCHVQFHGVPNVRGARAARSAHDRRCRHRRFHSAPHHRQPINPSPIVLFALLLSLSLFVPLRHLVQVCGPAHMLCIALSLAHARLLNALGQRGDALAKAEDVRVGVAYGTPVLWVQCDRACCACLLWLWRCGCEHGVCTHLGHGARHGDCMKLPGPRSCCHAT